MLCCLFAFFTLVAQPSSWCHYCVAILYCVLSQTHCQASYCPVTVLPLPLLHIVTLLSHCCWHCHISRCFPLKLAPLLRCYYPLCVFSYKHCQTLSHYCYIVTLLSHYCAAAIRRVSSVTNTKYFPKLCSSWSQRGLLSKIRGTFQSVRERVAGWLMMEAGMVRSVRWEDEVKPDFWVWFRLVQTADTEISTHQDEVKKMENLDQFVMETAPQVCTQSQML